MIAYSVTSWKPSNHVDSPSDTRIGTVSAAASEKFRFEWKAVLGLIVLIAFCALVFVMGLGVPMPLIGTWFGE